MRKETDLLKTKDFSDGFLSYRIEKQIPIQYYEVPWKDLVNDYKMVKGELTIISGYSGQGKSDVAIHLGLHSIKQGAHLFIGSFELSQRELYDRIGQCTTGIINISDEYWDSIDSYYHNKIQIYDEVGQPDFENLIACSEWSSKEWGCDVFIFDNLMMLTEDEDNYNEQKKITKRFSKFAKDFNVHVMLVAHSKKPQSKKSLNDKERAYFLPDQSDIKGCSSISSIADNHFSVTINQEKLIALQRLRKTNEVRQLCETDQDQLKKGCSIIKRDKRRNSQNGELFTEYLFYCKKFNRLYSYDYGHTDKICNCKRYVDYSNQK